MTVSIASSIVGARRQRDHRDARDHDLVDALVAELDDRVDHLLLLGLEDPLLAAALDDQAQLLGADPRLAPRRRRRSSPADRARDRPVRNADERAEDAREERRSSRLRRERDALGVGQARALGHELAEDDREQRQQTVTMTRASAVAVHVLERPDAVEQLRQAVGQADRGEGRGEEAEEGDPDLDDGEEPAGLVDAGAGPGARRALPSSTSCSTRLRRIVTSAISAADEEPVEQGQDDDDDELEDVVHAARPSVAGRRRRSGGGFGAVARGSAPAPRPRACRPARRGSRPRRRRSAPRRRSSRGATIIVSTPMNAPSPIVVAVLARAVVVGGDRAGADVDAARRSRRRRGSSCGAASSPAPRRVFLSSAKLPTSAPRPTTLPGRRWLYGPTVASSSTVEDSTTLAQTRARSPIVASMSWLPAPMTLPVADAASRRAGSRSARG